MDRRLLFSICILTLAGVLTVSPVAALGGYTITPATDVPGQEYHDFEEISFFEESPRMMLIELALFLSPALLFPAELLYSLFFISFLSFRRVTRQNCLDHEQRRVLYKTIEDDPGICFCALRERAGMNAGTARYHIGLLIRHGLIASHCRYGSRRYYVNDETYGRSEHPLLAHLHNENDRHIIDLLAGPDGVESHQDLMAAIGATSSSISWHMKRLVVDGVVLSGRPGKMKTYRLTPEAKKALETLNNGTPETVSRGDGSPAGSG
ncbi:MAG: hypothetical protein PWP08_1474 [Methanofollis sp.]|nr:hypothetical protein [Methanofollis sp.]